MNRRLIKIRKYFSNLSDDKHFGILIHCHFTYKEKNKNAYFASSIINFSVLLKKITSCAGKKTFPTRH